MLNRWFPPKPPKVYFLHIPKTAGTTLSAYLEEQYKPRWVYKPHFWSDSASPRDASTKRLVRGHFGWTMAARLPKDYLTITMLRNPYERLLSMLYHAQFDPEGNRWFPPEFMKPEESLEEVLESSRGQALANSQTRHLALTVKRTKVPYLETSEEFIGPELSDPVLLDRARKHLKTCAFFGLQEYFQESLILLADTLGFPVKIDNERKQSVGSRPSFDSLSASEKSRVKSINKLDTKLYEFAENLFWKRYVKLIEKRLKEQVDTDTVKSNRNKYNRRLIDHLVAYGKQY